MKCSNNMKYQWSFYCLTVIKTQSLCIMFFIISWYIFWADFPHSCPVGKPVTYLVTQKTFILMVVDEWRLKRASSSISFLTRRPNQRLPGTIEHGDSSPYVRPWVQTQGDGEAVRVTLVPEAPVSTALEAGTHWSSPVAIPVPGTTAFIMGLREDYREHIISPWVRGIFWLNLAC